MCELISVIVPVYNTGPYLRRCVESIIAQDYSNIEIIIVDDGSTEYDTVHLCDELAYEYDNVFTYHKGEDEAVFREKEGDAIITSQKNIAVGVFTADCTPVLLVDKTRNVVAAVHSGWKGTYKSITLKTINKMISEFFCSPQDIEVFIGPHIKKCCYEVSEELKEKFINEKKDIHKDKLFSGRNLSMEECILDDLKKCNINDKNINILDECTYCSKDIKLHSYRRTNGDYGRLFSFIVIK